MAMLMTSDTCVGIFTRLSHADYDPSWVKKFGDPVKDIYIALDTAVGELLACVDQHTYVVLFSGPGMEPAYTGNHLLDAVLQRLEGITSAQSPGSLAGSGRHIKNTYPFLSAADLQHLQAGKQKVPAKYCAASADTFRFLIIKTAAPFVSMLSDGSRRGSSTRVKNTIYVVRRSVRT